MRSTKIHLALLLVIPCLVQAQYMGGNGRGDASITLTNIPLPVDETPYYSPTEFDLGQNYPNPFNPTTKIKFTIPSVETSRREVFTTLKVYDVLGNEIATLVNEEKPAGTYEFTFDASGLPSGVYLYRLQAEKSVEIKKMLLIK